MRPRGQRRSGEVLVLKAPRPRVSPTRDGVESIVCGNPFPGRSIFEFNSQIIANSGIFAFTSR